MQETVHPCVMRMGENQFPELTLFLHDSECCTWEEQLNTHGVAMAQVANTDNRSSVVNSLANIISGVLSSQRRFLPYRLENISGKDQECEFTRFSGMSYEAGLQPPGIVQYHLKNAMLKCVSEVLAPTLGALSKKVPRKNVSCGKGEREAKHLEILGGTLLHVEPGALCMHWFKAETSARTIIFPVRNTDEGYTTIQVMPASTECQDFALDLGDKLNSVICLGEESTPVSFQLKAGQFIVLKEGSVFRAHNIQTQDLFIVCVSISVLCRDAGDPVLSPCRMALREVFTAEELRTQIMTNRMSWSPRKLGSSDATHDEDQLLHRLNTMMKDRVETSSNHAAISTDRSRSRMDDHSALPFRFAENAKSVVPS